MFQGFVVFTIIICMPMVAHIARLPRGGLMPCSDEAVSQEAEFVHLCSQRSRIDEKYSWEQPCGVESPWTCFAKSLDHRCRSDLPRLAVFPPWTQP